VLYDIAETVLFGFFIITLVFHYSGDQIAAQPFFSRWSTERLPGLESLAGYLPRAQTATGLLGKAFAHGLLTAARGHNVPAEHRERDDPQQKQDRRDCDEPRECHVGNPCHVPHTLDHVCER